MNLMRFTLGVVVVATLAHAGCTTVASKVGGGSATSLYRGNTKYSVPGPFLVAWQAAQNSLYDLGLPLKDARLSWAEPPHGVGTLESTAASGERIVVEIKNQAQPNGELRNDVAIRVGWFGDEELADRLMDQIRLRVASPGGVGESLNLPPVPTIGAPATPPPTLAP
jgi:hypothetical protein